jgi:hypothetical protein
VHTHTTKPNNVMAHITLYSCTHISRDRHYSLRRLLLIILNSSHNPSMTTLQELKSISVKDMDKRGSIVNSNSFRTISDINTK